MKRKRQEFWLYLLDDDRKQFSVEGPMTDDSVWNNAVCRAQQEGRHVRCASPPSGTTKEYIQRYWSSQGYTEAANPIVTVDWMV